MKSCSKQSGFSLVELMVVVTILGILTAVAVPIYRNQVLQAGRNEGKSALITASQRMEKHYSNQASFATATISDAAGATIAETTETGKYKLTFTTQTAETYTISAVPQQGQANDTCGTMTINHLGVSTPADCW